MNSGKPSPEVTKIRDEIDFHRRKVRLMGVTVSNLTEEEGEAGQLDLWEF
ncbi:MAG: hypothetical protein R2744_04890 [Bacteroidales bacterium]